LHQAWEAKRGLDGGVSNVEIDEIYAAGRKAGAWGGKLLGAGGGGFMLFFAPPETHPKLREVFCGRQILDVKINAPGSQIIFS
jgi:D-glycero-alpha-D-manno-heptose-7-phosphate kinase